MAEITIKFNPQNLSNVIKGDLSAFYNQHLTADIINTITQQLIESINTYINKRDREG